VIMWMAAKFPNSDFGNFLDIPTEQYEKTDERHATRHWLSFFEGSLRT
jgi:hypothetical protein